MPDTVSRAYCMLRRYLLEPLHFLLEADESQCLDDVHLVRVLGHCSVVQTLLGEADPSVDNERLRSVACVLAHRSCCCVVWAVMLKKFELKSLCTPQPLVVTEFP